MPLFSFSVCSEPLYCYLYCNNEVTNRCFRLCAYIETVHTLKYCSGAPYSSVMLVFLFVDDWRRILQASISCSVTVFMHLKKVTDCSNPVVYSSAEAVSRPSLLAVCLHVTYFLLDPRLPPSCPLASNKLYCLLTEADILEQLAEGCYMMMEWLGVAAVTSIMMASPMPFYTSTRRPYVTALWKRDWTGPIKSFYCLFHVVD